MNEIFKEDLSFDLHTALRKCCDSDVTSLAWNLFHIISKKATKVFYDAVWSAIQTKEPTNQAQVISAVRDAIMSIRYAGDCHLSALHCCFRMFSTDDWANYCQYLSEHLVGED